MEKNIFLAFKTCPSNLTEITEILFLFVFVFFTFQHMSNNNMSSFTAGYFLLVAHSLQYAFW